MKQQTLTDLIEQLEAEARHKLELLARQVWEQNVVPFCKRRNCRFVSGMGTFDFTCLDPGSEFKYETFCDAAARQCGPEFYNLFQLLITPSQIINGCPIGSFMPNFNP